MLVIYSPNKEWFWDILKGKMDFYPENSLTVEEQINFKPKDGTDYLITNSPFIIGGYDSTIVKVYDPETRQFSPVEFQTKGADFGVIIKGLTKVRSLMASCVVEEIRGKLKEGDQEALQYLETLGSSAEKAYLQRKLNKK